MNNIKRKRRSVLAKKNVNIRKASRRFHESPKRDPYWEPKISWLRERMIEAISKSQA